MTLHPEPDIELLQAFLKGNESAFEALYDRHYQSVLNVAYRLLGDRDVAEDIAQEVFLKLYTSPKSYKPTAKLSTWLYRVTYNAGIDAIRKGNRTSTELLQDSTIPANDAQASPQSAAESNDLTRAVESAIAALPENQRLAVILQRYEGLSYQEIAQVLKTSVSAIESLLFRAKETLKTRLSSYVR